MDRFRELTTFLAVADEGAFNAAARKLNMSPPAVTRLVNMLEERLGVRLFNRTTRQVALTDAGVRLRADGGRILSDLAAAEASATGEHDAPRGVLKVTAPVLFGQRFIGPVLCEYLDTYPEVKATTLFVDRVVDLIDEGLDVAIRIGLLPDSSLTATRVGDVRRVMVGSPDYFARQGEPMSPEEIKNHRLIESSHLSAGSVWDFHRGADRTIVRASPTLRVNTLATAIDATIAGWGISRLLSYQVAEDISAGRLVEVLAAHEDRKMPIHLVHSEGRRAAAKTRSFVDLAARRLRSQSLLFDAKQ